MKKENALQKAADFLGVSKESLQKDFSNENSQQTSRLLERKSQAVKPEVQGRSLEWGLLMTVLMKPPLFMELRKSLCLEDFDEPRSRKLFEILENLALSENFLDEGFPFESVCQSMNHDAWSDLIMRDAMQGEFEINPERVVTDGIQRIKINRLEAQSKKLSSQLLDSGLAHDEMNRLLQEKNFLIQEISRLKRNV